MLGKGLNKQKKLVEFSTKGGRGSATADFPQRKKQQQQKVWA